MYDKEEIVSQKYRIQILEFIDKTFHWEVFVIRSYPAKNEYTIWYLKIAKLLSIKYQKKAHILAF